MGLPETSLDHAMAERRSGITPHRHGGKGATPPCATSSGARFSGGSKGGRKPSPRQPAVIPGVSWLTHAKSVSQPLAKPPKPPLRAPSRTAPTGPSRATAPASGRGPHGRRGGKRPPHPWRPRRRSHPRDRVPPYPYPSGTRDRRSQAILRPAGYPKTLWNPRKRPLSRAWKNAGCATPPNVLVTGPGPLSRTVGFWGRWSLSGLPFSLAERGGRIGPSFGWRASRRPNEGGQAQRGSSVRGREFLVEGRREYLDRYQKGERAAPRVRRAPTAPGNRASGCARLTEGGRGTRNGAEGRARFRSSGVSAVEGGHHLSGIAGTLSGLGVNPTRPVGVGRCRAPRLAFRRSEAPAYPALGGFSPTNSGVFPLRIQGFSPYAGLATLPIMEVQARAPKRLRTQQEEQIDELMDSARRQSLEQGRCIMDVVTVCSRGSRSSAPALGYDTLRGLARRRHEHEGDFPSLDHGGWLPAECRLL